MLKPKQYQLLMSIYDYNRQNGSEPLVSKLDNTLQFNNDVLGAKLSVTSKTVQRLFKTMRDDDLMRTVVDNQLNKRYMVNPAFHTASISKYEKWFMQAMYHTGSHDEAIMWARLCRYDYKLYDYQSFIFDKDTGEVVLDTVRVLINDEVRAWFNEVQDTKAIATEQALLEYDLGLSLKYTPSDKDMFDAVLLNSEYVPEIDTTRYQKFGIAYKYIEEL